MVNVNRMGVVRPTGGNLGYPNLEPTSDVDESVWKAHALNNAQDVKLLVFDVDDASGCRSNPFRWHEPLYPCFFGGFDPWILRFKMFPGNA